MAKKKKNIARNDKRERPLVNIMSTDPAVIRAKKILNKSGNSDESKATNIAHGHDAVRALDQLYQLRKAEIGINTIATGNDYPQPPWDQDMLLDISRYNIYHHNCIKVKAEDSIRPGFTFVPTGKASEASLENKKILVDFFSGTNSDNQNSNDVSVSMLTDYQKLTSNMGMEVIKELGGKIIEIKHVDISRVRPHKYAFLDPRDPKYNPIFKYETEPGKEKFFKKFGAKGFYDNRTGKIVAKRIQPRFFATELVYYVEYEPGRGEGTNRPYYPFYGLPILIPLITASIAFHNQRWFNIKFFKSTIKNLIMIRGRLSDDAQLRLKDFVDQYITDPEMLSDLFAQSDDPDAQIDVKQLMDRTIDAAFQGLFTQTRDEIISGHKVPPGRIAIVDTGKLAGNVIEATNQTYKDTALAPLQRIMEGIWNNFIISSPFGLNIQDWKIEYNRLDTVDHKYLLEMTRSLLDRGAVTWDQALSILGIESDLGELGKMRIILSTYMNADLINDMTIKNRVPSNSGTDLQSDEKETSTPGKDVIPEINK